MIKSFRSLTKTEFIIWAASVAVVLVSNLVTGKADPITVAATLVGVTSLIFIAKGNVFGQFLTVVFSVLYAITSYRMRYYGEMITYLGMTLPSAIFATVSWIRHPYKQGEVKISKMTPLKAFVMVFFTAAATAVFYFILKALGTPNLAVSTVSITTSFLASYLTFIRNSYYAVAYAANDVVLIVLWILASVGDISYLPMIFCFAMFLINDIYGFISWKRREISQGLR